MVAEDSTLSAQHVEDRDHLFSSGDGAHCQTRLVQIRPNIAGRHLLMLGEKMLPENRTRGLFSFCSFTAVRNLAAPPTGSVSLGSTLKQSL